MTSPSGTWVVGEPTCPGSLDILTWRGGRDRYTEDTAPILEDFARLEEWASMSFVNKGKYKILHLVGDKGGGGSEQPRATVQASD